MNQSATPQPAAPSIFKRNLPHDFFNCALIAIVAIWMAVPGLNVSGLGWSDAPNHLFDGIFVYEFVKALPLDAPRHWAEQFYLRYPSLGILVYWPPGFAAVEAMVFAVFGVSVFAAKATVLAFEIGSGLLIYALCRRWFDRATGLFAALLLITCPHGMWWASDVMLEWPATFWILAAVYCYERLREGRKSIWSFAVGGCMVAAFMTKQTAGFILPVLVIHSLLSRESRVMLRRTSTLVAGLLCVAIIGGYVLATRKLTALPAELLAPSLDVSQLGRWSVEILGWPLLPIAFLGIGTFVLHPNRGPRGLLLLWFGVWTLFCLSISAKEPRYLFFSLPPLAIMAARFLLPKERALGWSTDAPRFLFLFALVLTQLILTRSSWPGGLPSYAPAVEAIAQQGNADLVLIDAVRDGQFIFDVYQNPQTRDRIIPLRASKLLYARAAREKYMYQQFVHSPEDIVALLNKYAIRYIVIESALPTTHYQDADPPPRQMLRNLLSTDTRFARLVSWPVVSNERREAGGYDASWANVSLQLYEYLNCPQRTTGTIRLSIPAMNREVELELPTPATTSSSSR